MILLPSVTDGLRGWRGLMNIDQNGHRSEKEKQEENADTDKEEEVPFYS